MSQPTIRYRIASLGYAVGMVCGSVLAEERPSFVLLMGDDQGWDEVDYDDHPQLKTRV